MPLVMKSLHVDVHAAPDATAKQSSDEFVKELVFYILGWPLKTLLSLRKHSRVLHDQSVARF